MTPGQWKNKYVREEQTTEEVMREIIIEALFYAKIHYLESNMEKGDKRAKVCNDFLEIFTRGKVYIDFK